jgi:hypothetical protein
VYEECEKGHGRIEIRRISVANVGATAIDFPGATQIFRLERETWRGRDNKHSLESVCGITSLTKDDAGPARLLSLTRGHWVVENRSHFVRDVSFGEDACRIRRGNGPHAFAALRNAAIGIARLAGAESIATAIRSCAWASKRALRAIGIAME